MNRDIKKDVVLLTKQRLERACLIVVAKQEGLNVGATTELRQKMRAAKADLKVIKNTLLKRAVQDTPMESLSMLFKGPTILGISDDPVAAAKVIVDFTKNNSKLAIAGGYLNGQIIFESSIKTLAALPSLDELRSKLIALIVSPATKIARLTQEPAARIARVLSARTS